MRIKVNTCVEGACILKNDMWFTSMYSNGLYRMSVDNMISELICEIPEQYRNKEQFQYKVAGAYENEVVLMPLYAEYVLIYNISQNTFKAIKILKHFVTNIDGAGECVKFRSSCQKDNKLWILPQAAHCIIEYDFSKGELIEYDNWYYDKYFVHRDGKIKFGQGIKLDNSIWIPCFQQNIIIKYSLQTKSVEYHMVDANNYSIIALANIDDVLWIITEDYKCIKWQVGYGKPIEETNLITDYKLETNCYSYLKVNVYDNRILLCPGQANSFISVDTLNHKITNISNKPDKTFFMSSCKLNKEIDLIFSFTDNTYAKYNIKENKIEYFKMGALIEKNDTVLYEGDITLSSYIEAINKQE